MVLGLHEFAQNTYKYVQWRHKTDWRALARMRTLTESYDFALRASRDIKMLVISILCTSDLQNEFRVSPTCNLHPKLLAKCLCLEANR